MEILKTQVTHKKYGSGTVTMLRGGAMTVFFDQYGSHSFPYPDAFQGDLKAADENVRQEIEEEILVRMKGR